MPCGKRPLVKTWDKPRELRTVKASRYQANEASVKKHWKNVIKELELSYQDERFWETQSAQVSQLVGPVIYARLVKIFSLETDKSAYAPKSETSLVRPSEEFYVVQESRQQMTPPSRPSLSLSDYISSVEEEQQEELGAEGLVEEQSEVWSSSSLSPTDSKPKMAQPKEIKDKSGIFKSFSKVMSKTMSRTFNRSTNRSFVAVEEDESEAFTLDDIIVHSKSFGNVNVAQRSGKITKEARRKKNPFFDMLYCAESETDMIKWSSNYKKKKFEISASDEYSKKAELLTKEIAADFFEWWEGLGNVEFKSEIKRPRDIEDLFQVWFDEHASRGLVLDPKILPCVLQSIANYVGAPKCACPSVLKRQIAWDIHAETSPQHTMAFGASLPHKLKHIPPKNNTKETWHAVKIPEDLRTMSAVWGDISNLTSTKAFHKWLVKHPQMPMPPYLEQLGAAGDKKQLFVVPSDFVMRDKSVESFAADLAIPISQVSLEIKEVLSRLLND